MTDYEMYGPIAELEARGLISSGEAAQLRQHLLKVYNEGFDAGQEEGLMAYS